MPLTPRKLHSSLAPIFAMPFILTALTGSLFQIAATTGHANEYIWLLELHRGNFGRVHLENVYPFFNSIGLLGLIFTGISMWMKSKPKLRRQK